MSISGSLVRSPGGWPLFQTCPLQRTERLWLYHLGARAPRRSRQDHEVDYDGLCAEAMVLREKFFPTFSEHVSGVMQLWCFMLISCGSGCRLIVNEGVSDSYDAPCGITFFQTIWDYMPYVWCMHVLVPVVLTVFPLALCFSFAPKRG